MYIFSQFVPFFLDWHVINIWEIVANHIFNPSTGSQIIYFQDHEQWAKWWYGHIVTLRMSLCYSVQPGIFTGWHSVRWTVGESGNFVWRTNCQPPLLLWTVLWVWRRVTVAQAIYSMWIYSFVQLISSWSKETVLKTTQKCFQCEWIECIWASKSTFFLHTDII